MARRKRGWPTGIAAILLLAACGSGNVEAPAPEETEVPEELRAQGPPPPPPVDGAEQIGTPMAERVATLGLLNKRNNVSQDIELKPGEQRRIGNVVIRLAACERTAPWEMPQETGGFVQVMMRGTGSATTTSGDWRTIFSGWLFKESPSLNVVEHPIYDVWMKDCAMTFPGEEEDNAGNADAGDDAEDDGADASETNEA